MDCAYPFTGYRPLGSSHLWAAMERAAVNTGEQISVQGPVFSSLGSMPRSEIVGSYSNSMFTF